MNLANNLTLLRIFLVPAFISCLLYYSPARPYLYAAAVVAFFIACATDALDGYVARRLNQKTVLGSYIDPIADKLLLVSAFLSLSFMHNLPPFSRIPAWVSITVIARDVIILTGSMVVFILTGKLKAEPLFVGKVTTVVQMGTISAALLGLAREVQAAFWVATVALTVVSGSRYVKLGNSLVK